MIHRPFIALAAFALPLHATAATLVVDDNGPADFTSIQAAIDAAADGDLIEVRDGTYSEGTVITTAVTFGGVLSITATRSSEWGGRIKAMKREW